jgi:hypothetical protein
MKKVILSLFILAGLSSCTHGQTIYVNAFNGKDDASGTATAPMQSLEKAITTANGFTNGKPVTIKLAPGLYVLPHKQLIKTGAVADTAKFTIEAISMPDDSAWRPDKMPVIQSVAPVNSTFQFKHCVALLVAKSNVSLKGLKFVGNASPDVAYYYPITREDENLNGLEVSQCYFIGEKSSTRLQSGLWTHGTGIHVDHCIFYGCRNAMVLIKNIKDFSLTYSIIDGCYESGIWSGDSNEPFVFSNNIVTHCNFVWVRPQGTQPHYTFNNSLLTENDGYMGYIANGLIPADKSNITENNISKTGHVSLVEIKEEAFQPHNYLNPIPGSPGSELHAGIFKK